VTHETTNLVILNQETIVPIWRSQDMQLVSTGGELDDLLLKSDGKESVRINAHHGEGLRNAAKGTRHSTTIPSKIKKTHGTS
jgi:hypothetical protein